MRGAKLSEAHRRELEQGSRIDPDVVTERGYRTIEHRDREELARLGIPVWALSSSQCFPGLLLPMYGASGEQATAQFKPVTPPIIRGKAVKYTSERGQTNRLDVHPRNRLSITDIAAPLWITEGIKKSDALTSQGCCVVTLTGVFNWRNRFGTLGDWEDIPIKRRDILVCFDADARKNRNVARAMVRLGRWLHSKGASSVRYLIVPSEWNGTITKGADDFFVAGGTLDALLAAATTNEPDTNSADDSFTDARLAETVADEVLADRFVWSKALGWLGWTGRQWRFVSEEAVLEVVRQFVLLRYRQAVKNGKSSAMSGWHKMLSARRERAVLSLTRGIVERDADEFDADPDLLNTPSGIVDLCTGAIQPPDPGLFLTKITCGSYRPGYTHPDWEQALTALPEETRPWFQVRVGQGITGYPTPDGIIPILQGGGENGKSAMTTDGIVPALGDYAAPVSPKLIASAKDEHSTERADLRGQRFLIAEELTEARALNMTAIKQITDVGTIRARYVFKDNFTFESSHSLFVTTNYIPVVNETDHGTWRRLALVTFPFTFRKPSETLAGSTDRPGDLGLKARVRAGKTSQHDAIVTWAVEGARRWYESGFPGLPVTVEAGTRAWRTQADRILGFWDEFLRPNPEACVTRTDLLFVFNTWMKSNGHHEWSKELFHSRFKGHVETARHNVVERRPRHLPAQTSRPPGPPWPDLPGRPCVYLGVRFRVLDEIDENTEEDREWSDRTDHLGTCTRESDPKKVLEGSDQSDQACCHGGSLELRCQLCRQSPTYWQRPTEMAQ